MATDVMNLAGVTFSMKFGEVVNNSGVALARFRYDGVFGLAFTNTSSQKTANILDALFDAKVISEKSVSIYINSNGRSKLDGEIVFGGVNQKRFVAPVKYYPVAPNQTRWTIDMKSVSVADKVTLCINGCNGAIYSGGHAIMISPISEAHKLNELIGATRTDLGYYQFDCKDQIRMPNISFYMTASSLATESIEKENTEDALILTPQDYTINYREGCYSPFVGISPGPRVANNTWFLGTAFLNKYHVVLDGEQMRIGFAESVPEQ